MSNFGLHLPVDILLRRVGVSVHMMDPEIGGRQVTRIMVSDPQAYDLVSGMVSRGELTLPEGVELMPRLDPWPRALALDQHVERLLVQHLEEGGAQGGLVFTRDPRLLARGRMSGFACENCARVWYQGEYPTWWHSNANPANWELSPGIFVWDVP